jgi:hypothetical protein
MPTSPFANMNFTKPFTPNQTKSQPPKAKYKIYFGKTTTTTYAFERLVRQTVEHWIHNSYLYTATPTTFSHLVQARVDLRVPCLEP